MKIKLTGLNLPKTSGYILQAINSNSGSAYGQPTNSISTIYYQEKTGVLEGERLGIERNCWIPIDSFQTQISITRSDKILIDLKTISVSVFDSDNILSIVWQNSNIVRVTYNQSLIGFLKNNWVTIQGTQNSVNSGIFNIIAIGGNYIDIKNPNVNDSSHNESLYGNIATVYNEFEIVDIKLELFSQFENHYEINIVKRNG